MAPQRRPAGGRLRHDHGPGRCPCRYCSVTAVSEPTEITHHLYFRRDPAANGNSCGHSDWILLSRHSATVAGTGRLRSGLFESGAKRSHPASGMALHGAAADAHRGGDLGFGQIVVIAQDDRLALPSGSSRSAAATTGCSRKARVPIPAGGMSGAPAAGPGRRPIRAAGWNGTGSPPPDAGRPRPLRVRALPAARIAANESCTTCSAVGVSRTSMAARRTSAG